MIKKIRKSSKKWKKASNDFLIITRMGYFLRKNLFLSRIFKERMRLYLTRRRHSGGSKVDLSSFMKVT